MKRINYKTVRVGALVVLVVGASAIGGYRLGRAGLRVELQKNPPKITVLNERPQDQVVDFSLFWEVWEALNSQSLTRPLDPQKLLYGAIAGLAQAIEDPYTAFLTPPQNEMLTGALNGEYEGIGAELGMRDGWLIIVAPLDGSPAEAVGVRAGDEIREIDDVSTIGVSVTEAVSQIRGAAGTVVRLTLNREGENLVTEITRAMISVPSVAWENRGGGVVYIRVSRFGEDTVWEWDQVVSEVISEMPGLRGVVLDLRSNPGGYLQAGIHIAEEFIPSGVVVSEDFGYGVTEKFKVSRSGRLVEADPVVLLDEGSASASEILAAALRSHRKAPIVGQISFGKGTVQSAHELTDGSSLHITVARWLTPDGESIDGSGLIPDVVVEWGEEEEEEDLQLERALEIAQGSGGR